MAERNQKVYERVRQELEKNADLGSRELYQLAQQVDKGIAQDTLQQFHARYVLPVKRERAGKRGGRPRKARSPRRAKAETAAAPAKAGRRSGSGRKAKSDGSDREHVRAVLLRFAQDFSAAETKADVVKVMSKIDDYVEKITG